VAGPEPDDTAIVRVEAMTARYGENLIFDRVSFEVRRGEVLAILGGSGSGKSTMLKHMIGLYRPASGRVWIDGEDIASAEGEARRRILRKIGVMYQAGALFGSMSLLENVRLPLEEFTDLPPEAMDRIAAGKLKMVDLEGFEGYLPADISGGMMTRAAIARAMALDPPILFLDEPSAGLDPITSAELDETILVLSRTLGLTFVVVTHELRSIYRIADRVIMLDKETKGIVASGPPAELRDHSSNEWVRRFFRRETGEAETGRA
jgi:phospholipid/cholesterol/gamma-HCH transport system ATP-binding protein